MNNLASALEREGQFEEVPTLRREALTTEQRRRTAGHWRIGSAQGALGTFHLRRERPARAEAPLRAQHENYVEGLGPDHSWTQGAAFELGACLTLLDRRQEAETLFRQSILAGENPQFSPRQRILLRRLVRHHADRGERDQAAHYRRLIPPVDSEG